MAVLGLVSRHGQSPFAIAAGNAFERSLYDRGGAALLHLYRQTGRLAPAQARVVNLIDRFPGRDRTSLDNRWRLTEKLLADRLARVPTAPDLIIQPRLALDVGGVTCWIEPDLLVSPDAVPCPRVGEVKDYADHGPLTEASDVRGALRQAAVGYLALEQTLKRLGGSMPGGTPVVDLVLKTPGSRNPSLRPMPIRQELASVRTHIVRMPSALIAIEAHLAILAPGAALDDPLVLRALPINWLPGCKEHCELAPFCKARALVASNPMLLGPAAREAYAAASTLRRVLELRDGTGPPPGSAEEAALAVRLRGRDQAYRRALGVPYPSPGRSL
jgi:hypothetical protein